MPYQGNECKEIRIHNNGMKKRGKSGEYKRLVRAMKQRVKCPYMSTSEEQCGREGGSALQQKEPTRRYAIAKISEDNMVLQASYKGQETRARVVNKSPCRLLGAAAGCSRPGRTFVTHSRVGRYVHSVLCERV